MYKYYNEFWRERQRCNDFGENFSFLKRNCSAKNKLLLEKQLCFTARKYNRIGTEYMELLKDSYKVLAYTRVCFFAYNVASQYVAQGDIFLMAYCYKRGQCDKFKRTNEINFN